MKYNSRIPIIDIFAGPGGLGEGFCALKNKSGKRVFKISLSIEKEPFAHQTLTLRSFFRQFDIGEVPDDYYEFLKKNISLEQLYERWPKEAGRAHEEALLAKLGESENDASNKLVDEKIKEALNNEKNWLLIGGPPCQAYSVVGRSRRQEKKLDESKDERVGLYKQYLRILAIHNPAVFVMENVKGLLSAETEENPIFSKILADLKNPVQAYLSDVKNTESDLICPGYKIYSLASKPESLDEDGNPIYKHKDYLIYAEKYGVPQTRHRVILLGVRNDFDIKPDIIKPVDEIPISKVLDGLPKLRSGLSKMIDNDENWKYAVTHLFSKKNINIEKEVWGEIQKQIGRIKIPVNKTGSDYIHSNNIKIDYFHDWFLDSKIDGVCNHSSRGHMESDLHRYLFVSCYAKEKNESPTLADFPKMLLPNHKNVQAGIKEKKFADRFRVQLWDKPSKTITSHISKDGHYYIHPDPTQCRSLTVREAARIQTFPDNYYFCGPRTAQYVQVGNAVPPYLANQIAAIVLNIFNSL